MRLSKCIALNVEMTKHLFKASPGYFWVNLANTLLNTFTFIYQTLFYKYVIDEIVYSKISVENVVVKFLLYYLVSSVTYGTNLWVQNKFNEKEKIKITLYYKKMIYQESVKKDIQKFSNQEYINMLHNVAYSDGSCLYAFSERIFDLLDGIIVFIFFLGVFLELHPIFIFVAVMLTIKNVIYVNKVNKVQYHEYQTNLLFDRSNRYLYNLFYLKSYAREFRMYPIGDFFIEKYRFLKGTWWECIKNNIYKHKFIDTINEIIDLFCYLFNVYILVNFLISQMITIGEFSLILTNFSTVVGNLQRVISFLPNVCNDSRYIKDIFSIIDSKNYTFPEVKYDNDKEAVIFRNVNFSYDGDNMVLKDININLPLNKNIAIVGENGSGKSTFVKLLLGLYNPTEGEIEYFYRSRARQESLQVVSTMFQDYRVFALSIADNIDAKEDRNEQDRQKIESALQFSGLKKKVDELTEGIDTVLTGEFSEEGIYLSGGEQQKLAISRAYIKEKPILILDEPSSNLDPIAENDLIQKINKLANDKAVILITHNVQYTKNADLVLFFDQGSIVEYGIPEELTERKGHYYKMLMEQTKMVGDRNDE